MPSPAKMPNIAIKFILNLGRTVRSFSRLCRNSMRINLLSSSRSDQYQKITQQEQKKFQKCLVKMTENSSTQTSQSSCFGTLENFIPGKDSNFKEYLERMEYFFLINKITRDREKVAAFVILAGRKVYNDLKIVVSPREVSDLTFAEIKQSLITKYSAKNNQLHARCEFYKRVQKEDETVGTFAEALRALAEECFFGEFLNEILRDRFIGGIRNTIIQEKLIYDSDQTFNEALEKARSYEIVEEICKKFARL